MRSILLALASLTLIPSTFAAAPIIGETVPPFGVQGVWANQPSLEQALDLMQGAGVRVARFDLCWWNLCEREPGVYNFTSPDYPGYENWNTDRLIEEMHARDIEPYAILCYGNAMYDDETGPHSEEGRAAFARFCRAAVERYRDSVYIWEIWNEPNLEEYWGREPDAEDYALMAIEAAVAIREANPGAIVVGPALSWLNISEGMLERWFDYLEVCGERGLFDVVDAVSVHPYRVGIAPETFNPELARIRELIARHTDREVDVWTGEWGYNTIWTEIDETQQAMCLARMIVNNMSQGVGMTTWFSFLPMEGWGLVEEDTWEPRPAYTAMRVANEIFAPPVRHVPEVQGFSVSAEIEGVRVEFFERAGRSTIAAIWLEHPVGAGRRGIGEATLDTARWDLHLFAADALTGDELFMGLTDVDDGDGEETWNFPLSEVPVYLELRSVGEGGAG